MLSGVFDFWGMFYFGVSGSLNLSLSNMSGFAEYTQLLGFIRGVEITNPRLSITPANISVSNLKIDATGIGSMIIPSYTTGSSFNPPAEWNPFFSNLFLKLLENNPITVTVSGETDAPVGTTLTITYTNDLYKRPAVYHKVIKKCPQPAITAQLWRVWPDTWRAIYGLPRSSSPIGCL